MKISGNTVKADIPAPALRRIYRAMRCSGSPKWLARAHLISMVRICNGFEPSVRDQVATANREAAAS